MERPPSGRARPLLWRAALLLSVVCIAASGTLLLAGALRAVPLFEARMVVLLLFATLFSLLAFGAMQCVFGFLVRRGRRAPVGGPASWPADLPETAIVLPCYNEDPVRVFAAVRAMYRSLQGLRREKSFAFFVLSDTNQPDGWVQEEAHWQRTCDELGPEARIHYRRRRNNLNKKAGNVADFCRRWGAQFEHMIVLDADSLMSGEALVELVATIERNPKAALVQSVPRLVRSETLFARIMQFTTRLYGPLFVAGMDRWLQRDANYWGHNAIIRIAPFMKHCSLPRLPGKEPFGGQILSHDFVEAALLRRAGWEVWMAPHIEDSYEESPPTLIDAAQRDRRWCQGNVQHAWLLLARGIRPISRFHLSLGILAYAASPVWLALLIVGSLNAIGFHRTGLTPVLQPGLLESMGIDPVLQAQLLLGLTAALLFGPKFLAVVDLFLTKGAAQGFGGRFRALVSVVAETLFSMVLAPVLMAFHSLFVVTVLAGRGVRWVTQRRAADGTSWTEALATHRWQMLLGLVWTIVLAWFAPRILLWMSPVLLGLLAAAPISVFTSRRTLGERTRRIRLFTTPEETAPPEIVRAMDDEIAHTPAPPPGVMPAIVDPTIHLLHLSLLPGQPVSGSDPGSKLALCERLVASGPDALDREEKLAVLSDRAAMRWLHRNYVASASGNARTSDAVEFAP
jgi:membrane glycosyltransferase